MAVMKMFARPKVNLFLHITGKRADGYHQLRSLVCFPGGGDQLSVTESRRLELEANGPFAHAMGPGDDNLVLRAARRLQQKYNITEGANLHLHKNLPVASGIGGGSADAAAALHLLCRLWGINPPAAELAALGQELGADLPVCLFSKPAIMAGIGEEITPVGDLPDLYILLVNPGIGVETPGVFANMGPIRDTTPEPDFTGLSSDDFIHALNNCRNDLQVGAVAIAPEITHVLGALEQCPGNRLVRMSGSGATCFALFDDGDTAQAAEAQIRRDHHDWWCAASPLQADGP